MGNIVDRARRPPKLDGFSDGQLHQNIHEALKALGRADDAYLKAVESIESQYLRSLEAAHDASGDTDKRSEENQKVLDQIAAVRKLF
jgi:hypothetical protein